MPWGRLTATSIGKIQAALYSTSRVVLQSASSRTGIFGSQRGKQRALVLNRWPASKTLALSQTLDGLHVILRRILLSCNEQLQGLT